MFHDFSLIGRCARPKIHAKHMRAFKTSAYSDDGYRRKQGGSSACHPKTTCKRAPII